MTSISIKQEKSKAVKVETCGHSAGPGRSFVLPLHYEFWDEYGLHIYQLLHYRVCFVLSFFLHRHGSCSGWEKLAKRKRAQVLVRERW